MLRGDSRKLTGLHLRTACVYLTQCHCFKCFFFVFYLVEDSSSTPSPPVSGTKLSPLYIAILCVVIPLLLVGGLLGGKKVYAKLWVPEGFPIYRSRRQPSTRRDPVGQEVSMR